MTKVFVVTCYMEGCEECGDVRHVVGVRSTYESAKSLSQDHEKNFKHLHSFSTNIDEAEVDGNEVKSIW